MPTTTQEEKTDTKNLKIYATTEDGFLKNFDDWDEEWVQLIQAEEGIRELTPDHTTIMTKLQAYFTEKGFVPEPRLMHRVTGFKLKDIYDLFPSGPWKGACKMAGLPKPKDVA